MDIIKGILNLIAFAVFYVPFNFVLMTGLTFLLRLLNKSLALYFPLWAVCTASAILVWLVMFAFTQSSKNSVPDYFLWTSLAINIGVLFFIVFSDKVFTINPGEVAFVWGKPQVITIGVFGFMMLSIGLIPMLNSADDVVEDYLNEKNERQMLEIIKTNNVEAFKKKLENPTILDKYKLNYGSIKLIEYLVQENKPDLVDIAYQKAPDMKEYSYNFDIKTNEMVDVLVKNGLTSSDILLPLIRHNNESMVEYYIEKHNPVFDKDSDIVEKVLIKKNDTTMLSFLRDRGMVINH